METTVISYSNANKSQQAEKARQEAAEIEQDGGTVYGIDDEADTVGEGMNAQQDGGRFVIRWDW